MTHGYENQEFLDTIGCLVENKCLIDYPNDGICLGEDKDGVESIQSLEQVQQWRMANSYLNGKLFYCIIYADSR